MYNRRKEGSDITADKPPRRPEWIKAKAPAGENYEEVLGLVKHFRLNTVCQSARCPNIGECWSERTATFMILGNTCTRDCRFCAVSQGSPAPPDPMEPERVADAAAVLKLKHAVVTSVTRDDLPDGGAGIFAATIRAIHERVHGCTVEVLIPDFGGSADALKLVMDANPEVLNHNIETVPRLYPIARPQADYQQSLEVLRRAKELASEGMTKSGLMVGVGESIEEVLDVMADLRAVGCDILTIGQYLRPSLEHVPIRRYYRPEEFDLLKSRGEKLGFTHIESGPLVRSSYHAAGQVSHKP